MSGRFAVPLSSSPPSTPDSRQPFGKGHSSKGNSFFSHPSTTPAGPPPSTANSFTPAGQPPPSSIFGSSQLKSGNRLFTSKLGANNGLMSRSNVQSKASGIEQSQQHAWEQSANISSLTSTPLRPSQGGKTFAVPDLSSSIGPAATSDDEEDISDDMDQDYEESDGALSDLLPDDDLRLSSLTRKAGLSPIPPKSIIANGSLPSLGGIDRGKSNFGSSNGLGTPRSTKRLRDSTFLPNVSTQQRPPAKRQKRDSAIPGIIQKFSTGLGTAKLSESDHLILKTESCIEQIYQAEALSEGREKAVEDILPLTVNGLCSLWRSREGESSQDVHMEDDVVMGIGPGEHAGHLQKAKFIAPLLLQLHHPPPVTGKQAFASSGSFRMSQPAAGLDSSKPPRRATPLPKVLRDWLEKNHNPYGSAMTDLRIYQPNPTANGNYWDILFNMLLRGKVLDVVETLKNSNFQYARTARDEKGSDGYQGMMLKNIGTMVSRMARVFEECPILREEDWKITGNDWRLFRNRVEQALANLTVFVEGSNEEQERAVPALEAPNFGLQRSTSTLGRSVREAERKIPSIIYDNLRTLYGIILGKTPEIVSSAQDWVEAAIGLTIWWDGEDDDDESLAASLLRSQHSLRRSHIRDSRTVDLNPIAAYIRRLAAAFERVTDDEDPDLFQINTSSSVEVCLASVFEGNIEGVISLLHGWSLPVSSAVAETANLGGWFQSSAKPEKMGGFSQSDLMVLSYGEQDEGLNCDDILINYAEALFARDSVKLPNSVEIEGWELSMQILSRLDDEELGIKKVGELLQRLPLTSDKRVDKILRLCQDFGLAREASEIAERYADHFTNETDNYGNALIYYTRARRPDRVKNVLDLLISLSVVESKAFPSSAALDDNLRALVERPKESLAALARLDPDAVRLIHIHLTGYASLRRFYDLRDEEVNPSKASKSRLSPVARRKTAMSTLIAVINSAADNIHGGLYDPDRGSIVPVDGLLALLGEASVFIDQPTRELSLAQCMDLLKAIEDLQTVAPRVYEQCEECFRCTLVNGRSPQQQQQRQGKRPDAREMLKKSISNVTSESSAFSLVESELMMMGGSETRESTGSEGVMVHMVEDAGKGGGVVQRNDEVRRGWDWRKGWSLEASGREVLMRMRMGLARDIARAWVDDEEL
ncbi:MAG: hypothetical protein Q9219_000680 [cf. Caloplaca sp. 3 TL-2023]